MDVNLIELARHCPELTISVKASDLITDFSTIVEENTPRPDISAPVSEAADESGLISKMDAAKLIRTSLSTLWRWENLGNLTPVRVGVRVYYRSEDIDRLLARKGGAKLATPSPR